MIALISGRSTISQHSHDSPHIRKEYNFTTQPWQPPYREGVQFHDTVIGVQFLMKIYLFLGRLSILVKVSCTWCFERIIGSPIRPNKRFEYLSHTCQIQCYLPLLHYSPLMKEEKIPHGERHSYISYNILCKIVMID